MRIRFGGGGFPLRQRFRVSRRRRPPQSPRRKVNQCPTPLSKRNHRNPTPNKILLILNILVRCQKNIESSSLGCIQKLSVSQLVPPSGTGFRDGVVIDQIKGEGARRAIVEQNEHLCANALHFRTV